MLCWWFKRTLKFPLYSPHTLLYFLERNYSIWITIGLVMSDMYGQRISKAELYLRGNYLKVVRSKNVFWEKFEVLNCEVLIPPDEWSLWYIYWSSRWFNLVIISCSTCCVVGLSQTHVALTGPTRQQVLQLMMTRSGDLTMRRCSYLALKEREKWVFSLILVQ